MNYIPVQLLVDINEFLINPKEGIAKTKSLYNIEPGLTDSINYVITNLDKNSKINHNLDILNMLLRYN